MSTTISARLEAIHSRVKYGLPPESLDDVRFLLEQLGYPVPRRRRCPACDASGCPACGGRGFLADEPVAGKPVAGRIQFAKS